MKNSHIKKSAKYSATCKSVESSQTRAMRVNKVLLNLRTSGESEV